MIKVLSKETIDKIAAGEVVERPMSIVKELLENSIDSGATSISVEIKDGGISLIRVTDNGSGINRDEVRTAFLRHATGKIEDAEDLGHIMTLGFRGEALSSISAVCRCEIITKTSDALTAVHYVIEGGTEKSFEEIGAPDGTTMLVRDIFYNTPARRKFLKTASTEAAHIADLVEKLALSHSEIAFKLIINGQLRLQTAGNGDLKAVIYSIYGKSIAAAVIPVELAQDGVRVTGFIGKPEISRPNRNYENYFVNGRYIKSNTVAKAIEDAYEDRMMSRQFPFALLTLTIDPSTIDVNVHPTKMDVRFSAPMTVYDVIKKAVNTALKGGQVVPKQVLDDRMPKMASRQQMPSGQRMSSSGQEPLSARPQISSSGQQKASPQHCNSTAFSGAYNGGGLQDPANLPKAGSDTARSNCSGSYVEALGAEKNSRISQAGPLEFHKPQRPAEPFEINRQMLEDPANRPGSSMSHAGGIQPNRDTQFAYNMQGTGFSEGRDTKPVDLNAHGLESAAVEAGTDPDTIRNEASAYSAESYHTAVKQGEQLNLDLGEQENTPVYTYIGQVFDTYIIIQMGDKMYIIDQHAAHEKIYYERFLEQYQKSEITSQMVDPPMIVTLTDVEGRAVDDNADFLMSMGYEIEAFGGNEYAVRAIPNMLPSVPKDELLLELIDGLTSGNDQQKAAQAILERTATMACKAAIKGNHAIDRSEADALLRELFKCDNPFNCPHGRPTMIEFTKSDMEKRFRRVL